MPESKLITELHDKMLAEQMKYTDWLHSQSPQEILRHAHEYTLREDILTVLDYSKLTNQQAAALLALPSPLEYLFRKYESTENSHLEDIQECIKEQADDLLRKPADIPVYMANFSSAIEHNELEIFRASHKANVDCRDAIETAIYSHYHNNTLDVSFARDVIDTFGFERVWAVMANTVCQMDWDRRISNANKTWAKASMLPEDDRREYRITQCHPGLIDLFCNEIRRIQKEYQQEQAKKPSIIGRLAEPISRESVPSKPKSKVQER